MKSSLNSLIHFLSFVRSHLLDPIKKLSVEKSQLLEAERVQLKKSSFKSTYCREFDMEVEGDCEQMTGNE
jgi:hypothetical protein